MIDDEEKDTCLYCSAYFHEQNLPRMREFFVHAAALQAQRLVEGKLPKKWGGEPAVRPGPSGIVRFAPEPALAAVQQACTSADDQPSPWTEEEFEAVVGTPHRPWVLGSAGPDGMTAEVPFRGTTRRVEATMRGGSPQTSLYQPPHSTASYCKALRYSGGFDECPRDESAVVTDELIDPEEYLLTVRQT